MATPLPPAVLRSSVRPLLDERQVRDALAWYYVFQHSPNRAQLYTHLPPGADRPAGFLVRAQTGLDLFRPLVTFRARDEAAAQALFNAGLLAGRPVYLTIPPELAGYANKYLVTTEIEMHRVYCLGERYAPQINVLVVDSRGVDGQPRCEINANGRVMAAAGVNWQSERFAEIFVFTEPEARGRGWGRAVVSALAGRVRQSGRLPLYVVAEGHATSIHLAEAVGFEDTGLREFVAQAVRPG